jgi:hypothetical protein
MQASVMYAQRNQTKNTSAFHAKAAKVTTPEFFQQIARVGD